MSGQAKALERVSKLMQLALKNPNEAEAMAAALRAVRLIDEHGLRVVGKPQPRQSASGLALHPDAFEFVWGRR